MKKSLSIIIFSILIFTGVVDGFDNMHLIDLPTTRTILRGYFDFKFAIYNQGGILTKVSVGITDKLTLGIIEDIGKAISKEKVEFSIPGVLIKLNIFSEDLNKMGWALGYDMFTEGELGKYLNNGKKEIIYGFYTVFSKPFNLFRVNPSLFLA